MVSASPIWGSHRAICCITHRANLIRREQCLRLRTTRRSTTESSAVYPVLVPSELIMDSVKFMLSQLKYLQVASRHSLQQRER